MDNINIESTLNFISKMDKKIIDEMDNITFEYNGLKKESEKLLQILNYSPKIIKPTREKIKNMKNIELPQLSELNELNFSKLYVNKNQRQEKENKLMIKNLLMSIIDDMIKNIENKQSKKEAQKDIKTVNEIILRLFSRINLVFSIGVKSILNLSFSTVSILKSYSFKELYFIS